jgi:hypothetical protein
MTVAHRATVRPVTSHGTFRVGHRVLAVLPPDDLSDHRRDEREVVRIVGFVTRDGLTRVRVADEDGVTTVIDLEMIERHA